MTHDLSAPRRAREYRRLSDKGGTSIEDQGSDNGAAAAENGWALSEPYVDDGVSASKYARKGRGDFEQLVADLQTGATGRTSAFGADILMLWESSRGSRRVGEWVSFIELCEEKQVLIWVTTHERLYDPRNGRDRKSLLDDAVDSEYESYKTHRRVTRTTVLEARKGRPHGQAPYGLKPVYDPRTGKLLTWEEDGQRAKVIRKLFDRLEQGHSFRAIEVEFRELGYRNKSGRPFTHGHLRRLVIIHSYAGLRCHKGTVFEGIWDGIIDKEQFWSVYRKVTDPSRAIHRGGHAVHALTAGLWCTCHDHLLSFRSEQGRQPVYRCSTGGMKIQKEPVDDLIIGTAERPGTLLSYLARKDLHRLLAVPRSDDPVVQNLRARLAQERGERDEMRKSKGSNMAEVLVLANSLASKEADVAELEERERELTVPSAILKLIKPGASVWDSWQAMPISGRREVVRIILSPRLLGKVYIHPSPRTGHKQPILERIEYRRTQT